MNSVLKHKFIVISGDTGNALGVIRALGEAGVQPILIYLFEATHLPTLIKSKYLTIVHKVFSYEEALDIAIAKYGNEDNRPFLYTCDDSIQTIVDERYDDLYKKFYFFNAGVKGRINHLMDKHVICKLAEECGCNIPKQEVVDTGILPTSLRYPVMTKTLKSTLGLWKGDSYICYNEEELLEAYSKIQSPKLLIEEYLNKQNEFSLQGYSCNSGQEVYIPYKITYLRSSSSSYGHYMKVETFSDESLFLQIKRIIEAARYEGCFEVEFLIDQENRIWFLEVNFRFSFWNYALTFGGVNYPIKWAESMLLNHIVSPPKETIKPYFTALNEPGDYGQSVVGKKISLLQWLKDIHTADMLYFYNPKDTLPAWSFWWHKITRIITKKISRKR